MGVLSFTLVEAEQVLRAVETNQFKLVQAENLAESADVVVFF